MPNIGEQCKYILGDEGYQCCFRCVDHIITNEVGAAKVPALKPLLTS